MLSPAWFLGRLACVESMGARADLKSMDASAGWTCSDQGSRAAQAVMNPWILMQVGVVVAAQASGVLYWRW